MTKTNTTTAAKPIDMDELREDLDLLKDDIEDVQTLWEQLESHYLSTAGLTGDKLRQFNAFVRMLTDGIDRVCAWSETIIDAVKR